MEINDGNKLCDRLICRRKKTTFLHFVASEQNTSFGGSTLNLINSLFFTSFPPMLIYLTMQWEMMSQFNGEHKESK